MEILVCVKNESDQHIGHHVDEDGNENVEVKLAEEPGWLECPWHCTVSAVYVISIEKGEEALRGVKEVSELQREGRGRIGRGGDGKVDGGSSGEGDDAWKGEVQIYVIS